MTKRFEKAFNALQQAYFNSTLAKGTCTACAVGNIVANAQGGEVLLSQKPFITKINFDCEGNLLCTSDNLIVTPTCTTRNHFWGDLFATNKLLSGEYVQEQHFLSNSKHTVECKKRLEKLTEYTAEEMAQIEYAFETNTTISYIYYNRYEEQEILEDQYKGLVAVVDVMIRLDKGKDDEIIKHKQILRTHPKLQTVC